MAQLSCACLLFASELSGAWAASYRSAAFTDIVVAASAGALAVALERQAVPHG